MEALDSKLQRRRFEDTNNNQYAYSGLPYALLQFPTICCRLSGNHIPEAAANGGAASAMPLERKAKTLRKKIKQAEALVERRQAGEQLTEQEAEKVDKTASWWAAFHHHFGNLMELSCHNSSHYPSEIEVNHLGNILLVGWVQDTNICFGCIGISCSAVPLCMCQILQVCKKTKMVWLTLHCLAFCRRLELAELEALASG